jgi:hypothetical protein
VSTRRPTLSDPRRFIAKPGVITTSYQGGSFGSMDVATMIDDVLGDVEWSTAAAYLTRRFGPPNRPCDPDKDICGWIITTPMKDLHLTFRWAPSGGRHLFGWIGMGTLFDDLMKCSASRETQSRSDLEKWCLAEKGVPWPPYESFREWSVLSEKAADRPKIDDLLSHAQAALLRTIEDLRRTVSINDCDLDIHGEAERPFAAVKPSSKGGSYIPPIAWEKDMWDVYGAIHRMGGGRKGLRALLAAAGQPITGKDGHDL